jgi:hypothetical protein
MWDYLTIATIGFSSLGLLLIGLKIRVPKHVRTLIALSVFASYWFTYGRVIDPEIGLNFLTSVVILKLLEKDSLRDSYMIFFGLILLLSAGALFEKTLTYVFFFTSSFLILLFDFYGTLLIKSRARELALGMLWVVPLTCVLFFVVPRIVSPLPFRTGAPGTGEIGYSPDVKISDVDSLQMNDTAVFQALIETSLPMESLYWRGNVLVQNDGWNWKASPGDHMFYPMEKTKESSPGIIHQKVRLFAKEPYLFALDHSEKFYVGKHTLVPNDKRVLQQNGFEWNPRYEAISRLESGISVEETDDRYTRVILNGKVRRWIEETFPSRDLQGLRTDIQRYFQREGFSYTLKPGRVTSFREFVQEKKAGFCSHFASATAIILRAKGIPTRLVSGFMGGNYNPFAKFYLVTQNDAHVWIESQENGKWVRMDPTAWIAPERISLGGETFLGTVALAGNRGPLGNLRLGHMKWLQDAALWMNQWDFKFYQWLEEMDYYGQEALLARLKFRREWLFTFAPFLIVLFVGLFVWQMRRRAEILGMGENERAWKEFVEKVQMKGLELLPVSIRDTEARLSLWEHPEKEKVTALWDELVTNSFEVERPDWKNVRKKIRRL